MEHNIHEETTHERAKREWDEVEEKTRTIFFGDDVMIPTGEIGKVVELDGSDYKVVSNVDLGWFQANELRKV